MMNGPEKSDPAIVAGKSANKAEQSAAEPMEQRAGTKGNAGQQSTHRTQSRTNVSQAQERIRKAARERKKERFTALFHHITVELLEEAFYALAQNAAPGVDRRTWKDYEAELLLRTQHVAEAAAQLLDDAACALDVDLARHLHRVVVAVFAPAQRPAERIRVLLRAGRP